MPSVHYLVNQTRLNVLELGNGPLTLIFLHYFGGSLLQWRSVMEQLQHQYRCVAVDLRGHGSSDAATMGYSVANMATDVAELVELLSIDSYVLIGHSMSGKIALSLASRQPPGLQALLLLSPSPPVPEPIPNTERESMLKNHGERAAAEKTFEKITAQLLAQSVKKQIIADDLRTSEAAWTAWLTLGSKEDISEQLQTILVPVSIIVGTQDRAIPPHIQTTMTLPYLRHATLDTVEAAGHLLPWETPNELAVFIHQKSSNLLT